MSQTAIVLPRPAPRAARRERVRTVRVALAGCGVVGGELIRLLHAQRDEIASAAGVRFEVARVLVRQADRPRDVPLSAERFTDDLGAFLAEEVDLVVEAMGGVTPALEIARGALAAGRRFVTANKGLIALHGPELARLARRHRARIDFESAVGGGIPVVRALRDSLPRSGVLAVRGILNGTTNYILTRLRDGESYADALADAQRRGFAEADPSRDVDGHDAADKVRILAWLAFGADPSTLAIRTRGILPDPDRLAADAAALGGVPRLLAECVRLPGGVAATVEPVIVAPDSDLGATRREQNLVLVETCWNGTIRLGGPGAGGGPTASVLLADMVRGAGALRRPPGAAPAAVADPRPHRWVVSVRGTVGELAERLAAAGVTGGEPRPHSDAGVARATVGPAPWEAVHRVELLLRERGLAPVVSRLEIGEA